MTKEQHHYDLTIIGGGLSGICAAITAARLGQKVALVQNRPVLGGNSSSEIRVWVSSATAHGVQRYARETGIMGELFLENEYNNPEGNPYLWDLVLLDAVKRQKNIALYLNTDVRHLEKNLETHIQSVTGWQMGAEREITFTSPYFMDCTGDGLIGFLAGADYRMGREAQHEYGELWSPEVADDYTLGSTIFFYTKDAGRPVPFVKPSFAIDIRDTSIPEKRIIRSGDNGCYYWWIEWGGELNTITDNERIRDELWGVVYGIWDYIKNSGNFPDSSQMTLEWVGSIPGKRESRRFIGDYVLKQQDILEQTQFEDSIAFGGWSIDLHPPQGIYSFETASKHMYSDGIYPIPYRCLYSRNIENLFFAGRNISASHVAFGSTRVMATCAVLGEVAGTAAALCLQHSITPRGLYTQHSLLQQTLLRQDASLIGVANTDPKDLAKQARVSASSYLEQIAIVQSSNTIQLEPDLGLIIPVQHKLERLSFLIDVVEATVIELEIYNTSKPQNYVPHTLLLSMSQPVQAGQKQWVELPTPLEFENPQNVFLILKSNPSVQIHIAQQPLIGVQAYQKVVALNTGDANEGSNTQPLRVWNPKPLHRQLPCIMVFPKSHVFAPQNVINPWARPYGNPNAWVSTPLEEHTSTWLELRWEEFLHLEMLHITFNDDVNEDLINLHHHRSPWRIIPEIIQAYQIEICTSQGWQTHETVTDNRQRHWIHTLRIKTNAIRIVIEATNGAPRAEIMQVRVY